MQMEKLASALEDQKRMSDPREREWQMGVTDQCGCWEATLVLQKRSTLN